VDPAFASILDKGSLAASRDALSSDAIDRDMALAVEVALGLSGSQASPLQKLRELLEHIRSKPRGRDRIASMNALVRTLGSRMNLAIMLDHLRQALFGVDEGEAAIARKSRAGRMHCIYGWAGQTLLLGSLPHPTSGTMEPRDDMDEFLGYPPAEWDLSIHIWQPNPEAEGFQCNQIVESVVIEPPHSHPFDFVSYVAIGQLHQSIYREGAPSISTARENRGHYGGVTLERVDGIWPPHRERQPTQLTTIEHRVTLVEGNSYFMPHHFIHDVEVDRQTSLRTPAITLFLPSEAIVKPHAFISRGMAQFHEEHPDLKEHSEPLTVEQWDRKLAATAAYLRGESETLWLGDIVHCGSTYGFMHR
jgi:hypothetical protein